MDYPDKEGKALRPHLEAIWEQRQRAHPRVDPETLRPKELEIPEPPVGADYVWDLFWDLNAHRGSTGFGPAPLNYTEIQARARLLQEEHRPWEIRAIMQMDKAFLGALSGKHK